MKRTKRPIQSITQKHTPRSAVTAFCKDCLQEASLMNCDAVDCPFYKYRGGKGRPSVKCIRKKCLECMGGERNAIEECPTKDCPLYVYRFGTNPNRMGIGGKK